MPSSLLLPGRGRHRARTGAAWLSVTTLLAALAVPFTVAVGGAAQAADGGTVLLSETFQQRTTSTNWRAPVGAGTNYACLTAGTAADSQGSGLPGCAFSTPAAAGSPAARLRLTSAQNGKSGAALFNRPRNLAAGLDVSFTQYQYGGTNPGADGISFFLVDGRTDLTSAGATGGSLGYANIVNGPQGVAGGLLGIGLDTWGNWPVETQNAGCTTAPARDRNNDGAINNVDYRNSIAVRGPGTLVGGRWAGGYCTLSDPVLLSGVPSLTTKTWAQKAVRVLIEPTQDADGTPVADPQVKVYLADTPAALRTTTTPVISVPVPAEVKAAPSFKFGFAASTGGSNNVHEIQGIEVSTVNPLPPTLRQTTSHAATSVGTTGTLTVAPSLDELGGPDNGPLTLTVDGPPEISLTDARGTGWACDTTTRPLACTYSTTDPLEPGTVLPPVTMTTTALRSGRYPVTTTLTSGTASGPASQTVDATFRPTARALSATLDAADPGAESSFVLQPGTDVQGNGPFTYAATRTSGPGTVTPTVDGVRVTATAGASGRVVGSYTVTDASSPAATSEPYPVTVDVRPVAGDVAGSTDAGRPVTLPTPAVLGTPGPGGWTWQLLGTSTDLGTATVDTRSGAVTFTPTDGLSGTTTLQLVATGADGVASVPATAEVTVRPTAGEVGASTSLDADGTATVVTDAPTATGSGPLTWSIVDGAADPAGEATIDAATGVLTFTATPGTSGTSTVTFRATDATGTTGDPQTATFVVRPHAPSLDGAGAVGSTVDLGRPAAVGTGPLTVVVEAGTGTGTTEVTLSSDGSLVATGPDAGRHEVRYHVTDATGLSSVSTAITVDLSPVARDILASATTASVTPVPVDLAVDVLGTTTPLVQVQDGTGPVGTVSTDGVRLSLVPAAGASGRLRATYTATVDGTTDPALRTSAPASVGLDVHPVATDGALEVTAGTTATVALPAAVGTGPFTVEVLGTTTDQVATVSPGTPAAVPTVTVAATGSGRGSITYRVLDADGLPSEPATVTLTVRPSAVPPGGGTGTPAGRPSGPAGSPVVWTPPAPTGTGPFVFALTDPDPSTPRGTAAIDPTTGVITFTPAPGVSGRVTLHYTVTGADGVTSEQVEVVVEVRPTTVPGDGRTETGTPVTVQLDAPVGRGPFTWTLADPAASPGGTWTLDAATGAATLAPAPGTSGRRAVRYTVSDADGIVSDPQTVTVLVAPRTSDAAAATAAGMPVTVQLPAPTGTGPFTWSLRSRPTAGQGTAEVTADGAVRFLPADGFSGTVEMAYLVADVNDVTSQPATVTVQVAPAATSAPAPRQTPETSAPTTSGTTPSPRDVASGVRHDVLARTGSDVGGLLAGGGLLAAAPVAKAPAAKPVTTRASFTG